MRVEARDRGRVRVRDRVMNCDAVPWWEGRVGERRISEEEWTRGVLENE